MPRHRSHRLSRLAASPSLNCTTIAVFVAELSHMSRIATYTSQRLCVRVDVQVSTYLSLSFKALFPTCRVLAIGKGARLEVIQFFKMGSSIKTLVSCVSFLLFSQALAWEWPFLSARTATPEPVSNVVYGACSNNGELVCKGQELFGTCNYGSVVYHPVAEGTVCEEGKIVRREDAVASCSKEGVLECHGSRMFAVCTSGKMAYHTVDEGTWCQDGQIVGIGSRPAARQVSGVPHSVVPHSMVPQSTIPHSAIPTSTVQHSAIPTKTIQHSTIPTSMIQHSSIPKPAVYRRDDTQVVANPVAKPLVVAKRSNADGSPAAYPGGGPTATIDAGVVHGTTTSLPAATATVNKYLGIPFAASPPVRFSPPQKPHSWSTPIDATAFKPACIQQFTCKFDHSSINSATTD